MKKNFIMHEKLLENKIILIRLNSIKIVLIPSIYPEVYNKKTPKPIFPVFNSYVLNFY